MTTWTPTRVAALRACRRRYGFVYRDHRDEPSSPEADLGDLVHAAMEDVGRAWLAGDRPENLGVALRTAAAVHGVNYGAATVACAVSVLSAAAASPLAALDDLAAVEHELSFIAPCPAREAGYSDCPICGGDIHVTTTAEQRSDPSDHPGGWWAYDGDDVACDECGFVGFVSADGEGESDLAYDESAPEYAAACERHQAARVAGGGA